MLIGSQSWVTSVNDDEWWGKIANDDCQLMVNDG